MSRRRGGGTAGVGRAPLASDRGLDRLLDALVEQTGGPVTARRPVRIVRTAGYVGSERSLRRAVARAKDALAWAPLWTGTETARPSCAPA